MAQLRVPATLMTPRDTSDRRIDFFAIPEELREYDQWVCWRYQARTDGKGGKIPTTVDAEGRASPASTTDPATWMSYQGVKWHGIIDPAEDTAGIGFVFAADDPFVGIDLDGCVDESGAIDEWAQEIIDRIDSYTEFSPSGAGIHIIAKGSVPPGGSRRGSVEMYDSNRFFTMTGHHVPGTPTSVEPPVIA